MCQSQYCAGLLSYRDGALQVLRHGVHVHDHHGLRLHYDTDGLDVDVGDHHDPPLRHGGVHHYDDNDLGVHVNDHHDDSPLRHDGVHHADGLDGHVNVHHDDPLLRHDGAHHDDGHDVHVNDHHDVHVNDHHDPLRHDACGLHGLVHLNLLPGHGDGDIYDCVLGQ